MMFTRRRSAAVAAAGLALATLVSGCTSTPEGGGGEEDGSIKVWIVEDLPDRVAATQAIVDEYAGANGVQIELVAVAEDQFNQLLTSSAAAGDLPDVIGGVSLPAVRTMSANELVDTEATAALVGSLGEGTFSPRALELTRDGEEQLAVPSESWAQLLIYRKDLFDAAGLAAPDSYEAITAAAEALDSEDVAGFVGATAPGDSFTQQTFEHLALGNGCELVDQAGTVTFGSPQCVSALGFYGDLVRSYSVPGAQDVDTTRATYFAGQAAMTVWSTFILDEMAGLREDALPTCPECEDNPAFLAENSGVVTAIAGPDGTQPATYGEVTSWVITAESSTEASSAFVEHLMGPAYLDWLAIAPEGKVPVRAGSAENPSEYSDGWADLEVGVDTKAPLTEYYSPEVIDALTAGPTELARWAIPQGQGDLIGAIQGEQPIANAVNAVADGADPAEEATAAAEQVTSIGESIR